MFDTASNNKINTKTTQISLSNSNINAKATQINFYLDADRSGCDGKTNMQETVAYADNEHSPPILFMAVV